LQPIHITDLFHSLNHFSIYWDIVHQLNMMACSSKMSVSTNKPYMVQKAS
jgi:hypothetical protein